MNSFNISKFISNVKAVINRLPNNISIILENNIANNFRQEQSPDGNAWTKRKRVERGKRRNLLVQSGALRRDATLVKTQGNKIFTESSLPYAGVHQEGNSTTPARPFVGMSKQLEKEIEEEIIKQINKAFR